MAISRIRGEQIRQNILVNAHIAEDAGIEESKLSVNWSSHYAEALETKKVVDYVQVTGKTVNGLTELNLSTGDTPVLVGTAKITTSAGAEEGVITDAPYNKVVIRNAATGDSFLDEQDGEVFGRLVHDGVDFKVLFVSVVDGLEAPFTMPVDAVADFQYMERFNLRTISELFAANEKFVSGAADITAFQNIQQLARDIYGAGYSLDRDGEGNLEISLVNQLSNEVTARTQAITALKESLQATGEAGKGANLIGIEDLENVFTSVTVEGALQELNQRLRNQETGGGAEVTEAHASTLTGEHLTLQERLEADATEILARLTTEKQRAEAAEQELSGRADALEAEVENARKSTTKGTEEAPKEFASVDDRLEEIEADHKAEITRATDAETAIQEALATEAQTRTDEVARIDQAIADADTRMDVAINEDGTLKAGAQIHSHFRARYLATGGENEVLLSAFNKANLPNFQVGDDSLEVFINGQLQEPGLNYQEGTEGEKIVFDLGDGTILDPTDIVQIKYYINNAQ